MIAFAFDIMGLLSNLNSTVGMGDGVAHIAHIGGAIVGLIYGFKVCGFRRALKIIIGAFILMLLLPFIWNLWVYFVKFILRLV